tara:strand:- start:1683 stop:1964 length:282 start_codon:yes stop_codon:yes gene_type:complete
MNQEKDKINVKILDEMVKMVMRQTELTYDDAKEKLIQEKFNYLQVIKNELGIIHKKENNTVKNINQETYSQIRKYMDVASSNFRRIQEENDKK